MMELSEKAVSEFKEMWKKEFGKDLSDAEAIEYSGQLTGFVEVLIEIAETNVRRKKRLEKEPEGFHLDEDEGSYGCRVCNRQVSGSSTWWDLNGVKCLDCQRNIKKGVIPGEICQNDDLVIKNWQLNSHYGLRWPTVQKLRREGALKGRDLKTTEGVIYHTVYIKNENKKLLKEIEAEMVKPLN
jgi:hypothetical protein